MNVKSDAEKEVTRIIKEINGLTGKLAKYQERIAFTEEKLDIARKSLEKAKLKATKK